MRIESSDGYVYEMLAGPSEFVKLDKESIERNLLNGNIAFGVTPSVIEEKTYPGGFTRMTLRWPTRAKRAAAG